MLNIFKDNLINEAITKDPKLEKISMLYREDYEKIKNYYYNRTFTLNNSNMLVRLIKNFDIDYNRDLIEYYKMVEVLKEGLVRNAEFTAPYNRGKFHTGIIFEDTLEAFLVSKTFEDIFEVEKNWKELNAIKLIKYDRTDLRMNLPLKYSPEINDYYIYNIDVELLLLQYRFWTLEQVDMGLGVNPVYFLTKIVLPGIIPSMIDHAIINRAINLYSNIEIDNGVNMHPFLIRDFNHEIDKILKVYIKNRKNTSSRYETLLENLHTIFNNNALDTLKIPDIIKNRQTNWLIFLSRLKYFVFLLEFGGTRAMSMNRDDISETRILIKQFKNDKSLENLDPVIEMDLMVLLDKIKEYIGER